MEPHKDPLEPYNEGVEIIDLDATPSHKSDIHKHPTTATRLSSQQRLTRVIAIFSVFLLALGILWGSYAPVRSIILSTVSPPLPTPTATILPGTDLFYLDANPSWGTLMIDGKQSAYVPVLEVDAPLRLSRGPHHFQWSAAPFLTQHCDITVPPDYVHDTCYSDEIVSSPLGDARFFRFPASLGMLSDAQSQMLVNVIQATLDAQAPTTTIERGAPYASDIGPLKIAQQTLRAKLHFKLDVNIHSGAGCSSYVGPNNGCIYNRQDCRTLCSAADLIMPNYYEANIWVVLATVQPVWDYSALNGVFVAHNQPDIVNGAGNDNFLPLKITWDGTHWHVATFFSALTQETKAAFDPVCGDAQQHQRIDTSLAYIEQMHAGTNWQYISDNNWSDGCLAIVSLDTSTMLATPASAPPVALCLHRFGTFVALNTAAHQFWPGMPRATTDEQQIAQHLATQYHGNV